MGRLVVIDGLDGSGKTTQFDRVGEYLERRGTSYKKICFPVNLAVIRMRSTPMRLRRFMQWTGMPAIRNSGRRIMRRGG